MGTPYTIIYESFLSRLGDNEYAKDASVELIESDLKDLLKISLQKFKFPRTDLSLRDDETATFLVDLEDSEIEVIACYMKAEWAKRCVTNWRLIYPQYQARDFKLEGSPANHLDKLQQYAKDCWTDAQVASSNFHRSIKYRPYNYGKIAGSTNER